MYLLGESTVKRIEMILVVVILAAIALWVCGCQEEQKVWGQGELPADYQKMFGDDNGARLNFIQEQEINKLRANVYGFSHTDKDGKVTTGAGLIERITALKDRVSKIEDTYIQRYDSKPEYWQVDEEHGLKLTPNSGTNYTVDPNEFEYAETGGIPICPYCKKPTERTGGVGTVTAMYFPPVYDEEGNNTNPDRNISTSNWYCSECGNDYETSGNAHDGYSYRIE